MEMVTNEACDSPKVCCDNDVLTRLQSRKRCLERELVDVNAALEALDSNPEVTKVLVLLTKAIGRF